MFFVSLLQTKIPFLFFKTCLISSKIITGFNLANDSEITLGKPSVYDGKINIREESYNSINFLGLFIGPIYFKFLL